MFKPYCKSIKKNETTNDCIPKINATLISMLENSVNKRVTAGFRAFLEHTLQEADFVFLETKSVRE